MAKAHYTDSPKDRERKKYAKFLAEDEELILVTGWGSYFLKQKFLIYIFIPGAVFMLAGVGYSYFTHGNIGYGLGIGLILSILAAWFKVLHDYHAHRYLLTTRRVLVKDGVFAVKLSSALYDKITHIEVDQGFIDRLFYHYGTVIINTAGMNKIEMKLNFVDYPIEFKNLLERLINREREQYARGSSPAVPLEGELVE